MRELRVWAKDLRRQVLTLAIAIRDPKTPWYAKMLGGVVLAYALSPIDLIPDFVPVLGLLDDLILVPAGIALTVKLIPRSVIEEAATKVDTADTRQLRKLGLFLVISAWAMTLLLISAFLLRRKT